MIISTHARKILSYSDPHTLKDFPPLTALRFVCVHGGRWYSGSKNIPRLCESREYILKDKCYVEYIHTSTLRYRVNIAYPYKSISDNSKMVFQYVCINILPHIDHLFEHPVQHVELWAHDPPIRPQDESGTNKSARLLRFIQNMRGFWWVAFGERPEWYVWTFDLDREVKTDEVYARIPDLHSIWLWRNSNELNVFFYV